jgi:2-amino-4-hydroxy-6-hydroxymethyldihydropteridine diphosphokinase
MIEKSHPLHKVFIGIGANLGHPLDQCREAVARIANLPQTHLIVCSSFYSSPPMVLPGESAEGIQSYVNAACFIETSLDVWQMFEEIRQIESEMGRVRVKKWESRVIDLDLLFFDDLVLETEKLSLPHPGIETRDFVVLPLAEIAPEWIHPHLGKTLTQLRLDLPSMSAKRMAD